MSNGKVSLHDVLEISDRIEQKLDKMETRVSAIEIWRAQFIGQLTVIIGVVNLAIAVSFDWIKKQIFHDKV